MARGCFGGLFLRGVARQAIATVAAMVRGAWRSGARLETNTGTRRAPAPWSSNVAPRRNSWPNGAPGRNWQGLFCTEGRWASGVRNHKTLSALERWFGFKLDEIFSAR